MRHWRIKLHPHAHILLGPSLVFIAAAGTASWLAGRLGSVPQELFVLGFGLVTILSLGASLLRWSRRRLIITPDEVILSRGWLIRRRQRLPHGHYLAQLRRGPNYWLFGSAQLVLKAYDQTLVFKHLPDARLVLLALEELSLTKSNPPIKAPWTS